MECSLMIDRELDARQPWPQLSLERTVAYEARAFHLTRLRVTNINAHGCQLKLEVPSSRDVISYVRMGAAQDERPPLQWSRTYVSLDYRCPKIHGRTSLRLRGNEVETDKIFCSYKREAALNPNAPAIPEEGSEEGSGTSPARETQDQESQQREESDQPHVDSFCDDCASFGLCAYVEMRCQATDDRHCAQSKYCKEYGRCAAVNGDCRATQDDHCMMSEWCEQSGRCSAVGGECVVKTDKDCVQHRGCKNFGECSAVEGDCVVKTDKDCLQHKGCASLGWCSAVDGRCRAKSIKDCRHTQSCLDKRCIFKDGVCL